MKIYDADNVIAKMELQVSINEKKDLLKKLNGMSSNQVQLEMFQQKSRMIKDLKFSIEMAENEINAIDLVEIEIPVESKPIENFDPLAILMGKK